MNPKVWAIIPAHNEEKDIAETLNSILNQAYPVEKIIVALDNCTDKTEEIVKQFPEKVRYFHTVKNKYKKAGALNQAFDSIREESFDYLLQMDADSYLTANFIEEGIRELSLNTKLAGLCSRFRIRDYRGGNYLLYCMQYLEYSLFDSIQVEKKMQTHVLSGTATLFKQKSLINYLEVWNTDSIVEDYELTLRLKKDGWNVKVGKNMHIKTDYMQTFKDLWRQRKRWNYGTVEELYIEGWTKYTKKEILTQILNFFMGGFQILFLITLAYMIFSGIPIELHILGILVPFAVYLNKFVRLSYIQKKSFLNMLLYNTLIPEYLYSVFLTTNLYISYLQLATGKKLDW